MTNPLPALEALVAKWRTDGRKDFDDRRSEARNAGGRERLRCADELESTLRTQLAASSGGDGAKRLFVGETALADWLDSLHATSGDGAVTNEKWEPAQRAAAFLRDATRPAAGVGEDVAELIAADREYDAAERAWRDANCNANGDESPGAWRKEEQKQWKRFSKAAIRRSAALARLAAAPSPGAGGANPRAFQSGDRVEWEDSLGRWHAAKIIRVHDRVTTYTARLDDGTVAEDYAAGRFRRAATHPKEQSHG